MAYGQKKYESPGKEAIEELAESLYKDKRHVLGLKKIFNKISPPVSEDIIVSFCNYWMKREDVKGRFPFYFEVEKFVNSSRKKNLKFDSCSFNLCDGTGNLELKPKGSENPKKYRWGLFCKCVDVSTYKEAMKVFEPTKWQKDVQEYLEQKFPKIINYNVNADKLIKKFMKSAFILPK